MPYSSSNSGFQPHRNGTRHSVHELAAIVEFDPEQNLLNKKKKAISCAPLYQREDSGLTATENGTEDGQITSPASPDYSVDMVPWLESQQVGQTSEDKGWMDQVDASDALKKTMADANHKRASYKNTFLRIPSQYERRSLTREGTPMSTCTIVPVVPIKLSHRWKKRGDEAFLRMVSALYAKFLVVMGLAFPMTEVISNDVTSSSYLVFYLYLYFGCIIYFLYVILSLIRHRAKKNGVCFCGLLKKNPNKDVDDCQSDDGRVHSRNNSDSHHNGLTHHGSFYLRIGAVAFGVGSMIYSGLEFAQYFEIEPNSDCHNILFAVTPASRMLFTFIQMYFIFLNAKMTVCKHKAIAYFGLMHMVATNLCVWLNVIIEETKHEILHYLHHNSSKDSYIIGTSTVPTSTIKDMDDDDLPHAEALVDQAHLPGQVGHELTGGSLLDECKRSELMGNLVQGASPLLFPCAIEYSLICAAILYVMWRNVAASGHHSEFPLSSNSSAIARRSRHHYSVDCAKANKGLFAGIFVFVLTIISLIMFFALINHPSYTRMAIMEVGVIRFILFFLSFCATIMGIVQIRELRYDSARNFDLDDVLLVFGQLGLMAYNIFTIIAGYYSATHNDDGSLVLLSALAAIVQAVTQTLFILDAGRRNTYSLDQQTRKPGREVVTFLLVANFAMWTVNTLEKSRAEVNPVQLQFYGLWPWIIITNISMPLAIFYRFHSTVVLCEIWKRCYKRRDAV